MVGDLFVGFRFGNESDNLLLAEREGVPWFVDGLGPGCAACGTSVLFSAGVKTVSATSTTSRQRCASRGQRDINLFHNYWCKKLNGFLLLFALTAYEGTPLLTDDGPSQMALASG
jgi:hypothetical protein